MQCRICLVDLVAARDSVGPDVSELIEVIDPAPRDKDEVVNRRQRRLQEAGRLICVITDEGWPKNYKGPFLPGVQAAIKKTVGQR